VPADGTWLHELVGAPGVRGFRDAQEGETAALVATMANASGAGVPAGRERRLVADSEEDPTNATAGGHRVAWLVGICAVSVGRELTDFATASPPGQPPKGIRQEGAVSAESGQNVA
jgi:hypothetical protein